MNYRYISISVYLCFKIQISNIQQIRSQEKCSIFKNNDHKTLLFFS